MFYDKGAFGLLCGLCKAQFTGKIIHPNLGSVNSSLVFDINALKALYGLGDVFANFCNFTHSCWILFVNT